MPNVFYSSEAARVRPNFGWRDALLFAGFFSLFYGVMHAAHAMNTPYVPSHPLQIDLSPAALIGYSARSVLRMFLAFGASIVFTLGYGYVAANSKRWEKVLIPLLDILQSVPVLGFLSATVTIFMALFPGSVLGLECASIFAIFTGQAWNMTFSFYNSLRLVPQELKEAAQVYQLSRWQRFIKLEVPYSMLGLVWNGMMSFGGGWFFLAASEAITVLNHRILLPGIGSYMSEAVERGDGRAVCWAIFAMILIVVLIDQLFWRPIVAWAQKFKFEQIESGEAPTSVVLDILQQSALVAYLNEKFAARWLQVFQQGVTSKNKAVKRPLLPPVVAGFAGTALFWGCGILACYGGFLALREVHTGIGFSEALHVFGLGWLTLARVLIMVVLATLIWTPIGVYIGLSPRLARIAQPLVQIGASFPANLLFPVIVLGFIRFHIDLNFGSILLLALGTQWYIVFNVISGTSALPSDLREAAAVFQLKGWSLWRKLILPAIFPSWVTGALTAAGGAWNASIVAEVASWGTHQLKAQGLGAYIAAATERGDWPAIIFGIFVMSVFVVALNQLVWRRLYGLAERRYRFD